MNDQQADTLLREALANISRKELATAERLLDIVLASRPGDPNALYVLGQLRHLQNRLSEAQTLYRRALAHDASHPLVHFQLGQTLMRSGQVDEAIAAFQEALRLDPALAAVHYELGLALFRKQDFQGAERSYRQALTLQSNLLPAIQALSTCLTCLARPKDAEIVARSALAQAATDPNWYAAIKHSIALAISEQHRYEDAILAFEELQAIAPNLPFLEHNRANALLAARRIDSAETSYRNAVARDPSDLMAHRGLNHLLWRNHDDDFLKSYDRAAETFPQNSTLFVEKGRLQLLYERNGEALESFEHALQIAPNDESAREGLASALTRVGRFADAVSEFKSIAARWPKSAEVRAGLAECYLRSDESMKARAAAEDALSLAPNNQLALAFWNTALRQQNDAEGEADYQNLIGVFDLSPPEGFADLDSFHAALSGYLNPLHGPLPAAGSTGMHLVSRTSGSLFGAGHEAISALRKHLDLAVAAHVSNLPMNGAHRFLRRRDKELRYAGSWSTRVASGGKIANHIHDNGWLSGIYFVEVPADAGDEVTANGWAKFGEPPFAAHLTKPVARVIQPAPGRLILFPSYLWHGSNPFYAPQSRLTVSFDAVPEPSRD